MKNEPYGLSLDEIKLRKKQGLVNNQSPQTSKTYQQIFKDNVLTLFNLLNFIIFIALLWVQAWTNLVFIFIIIANICIGIYQEVKAKKLVDQLSILTMPTVYVVREGKRLSIDISDIVKDDILVLESGYQVCNDAHVIAGSLEVNESLLTGESDSVYKQCGDILLSGSSVVSGKCYAQVDKVGQENYATSLVAKAQKMKNIHSELMLAMKKVTKFTTFLIVPIGIVLFYQAYYARNEIMFQSIVSCSAALLGMLPKGLVLLTSVSLANGVTRLAKKNVLTQDLYSLETLSHVDVLCLDKTGTITNGKMKVEKTFAISQLPNVTNEEIIGSFLQATDDNNATFLAMESYFKKNHIYQPVSKIPFSSLRKWSAIEFENFGTVVVGAVEKILISDVPKEVQEYMEKGLRAIAIGWTPQAIENQQLPALQPLMVLIISDTIRQNTKETLAYFHKEGIDVKIISGDNLSTVSSIAKTAGVIHSEKAIDMSTCENDDLEAIVENYTVFARVTPLQKKLIVEALQKRKHRVAMTGDGVNDLLALKEADCSIAIADGSDASKQISQVVLLNNDFTCLPDVLLEGRKVVNNVTRVAGVFFIKTIYTILLSVICIFVNQPFPFIPLQITVIDFFIEAMPSFLTMFEENIHPVKKRFLSTVLSNALPYALSIIICYLLLLTLQSYVYLNEKELLTLVYIILVIVSMSAVIRSCYPWSPLRIAIISFMVMGMCGVILITPSLLHIESMSMKLLGYSVFGGIVGVIISTVILKLIHKFKND